MPAKSVMFLESSNRAWDRITEVFDFIWPTAAALWNLRWQVNGYLSARPCASADELKSRFGAGVTVGGLNLRRSCVEHSWEQQEEQFATFLLIDVFTIYESWAEASLRDLGWPPAKVESDAKAMQRPSGGSGTQKRSVKDVIGDVTQPESTMLRREVYPGYASHRRYAFMQLDSLMTAYRYYKECRNSYIHRGGDADARTVQRQQEFLAAASSINICTKEVPSPNALSVGLKASVSLREAVWVFDLILRIITTVDAEFCRSERSECILAERWRRRHSAVVTLKSDQARREKDLSRMIRNLGMPTPTSTSEIERFLRNAGLVR